MSSLGGQGCGITASGDGLLFFADRGGWLESDPHHDWLPIADSTLDPTGIVGGGVQAPVCGG